MASDEVRAAFAAFRQVAGRIEEAKALLLLGIPSGRAPRVPLAEALAGFERVIGEARAGMEHWLAEEVRAEWTACDEALDGVAERAERFRLEATTDSYEEIVPLLDGMLDPLEAFDVAASRFRSLGA
jgi:hypothetical protein